MSIYSSFSLYHNLNHDFLLQWEERINTVMFRNSSPDRREVLQLFMRHLLSFISFPNTNKRRQKEGKKSKKFEKPFLIFFSLCLCFLLGFPKLFKAKGKNPFCCCEILQAIH